MTKIILLNSGGLDTLATVKILKEQEYELYSLYVDLGHTNSNQAKIAAKKIADKYCKSHDIIKVSGEWACGLKNDWWGIPHQSMVVFALGAMYATKMEIKYLASGLKIEATEKDFNEKFTELMKCSKKTDPIILVRPLSDKQDFKEVFEIIKEETLLKETVSCNKFPPCKECIKCERRKEFGID